MKNIYLKKLYNIVMNIYPQLERFLNVTKFIPILKMLR